MLLLLPLLYTAANNLSTSSLSLATTTTATAALVFLHQMKSLQLNTHLQWRPYRYQKSPKWITWTADADAAADDSAPLLFLASFLSSSCSRRCRCHHCCCTNEQQQQQQTEMMMMNPLLLSTAAAAHFATSLRATAWYVDCISLINSSLDDSFSIFPHS